MPNVAQLVRVPPQPPMTPQQQELSHKKSQEAIQRSQGVDGWEGTVILASAGVPKLALSFWRDNAALEANLRANPDAIARSQKAGLIDAIEELEVIANTEPDHTSAPSLVQVFRMPAPDISPSAEQVEQARQVARDALDRQQQVDGCEGCVILGSGGVASISFTFWRDEAALQAASGYQAEELASAKQADPSIQISEPEILEIVAGASP